MRTEDVIKRELQKLIANHMDIPPDEYGEHKISPMTFFFLSIHPGCRYKISIELQDVE